MGEEQAEDDIIVKTMHALHQVEGAILSSANAQVLLAMEIIIAGGRVGTKLWETW